MDSELLNTALTWAVAGHAVTLVTLVQTWGAAPRPVGALLLVRDDGVVAGSVSGGCVEEDLIQRVRERPPQQPERLVYGVTREEASRFGLPCGGQLAVIVEPFTDLPAWQECLRQLQQGQLVARCQPLCGGAASWRPATADETSQADDQSLLQVFGPRWRMLIIGAGEASVCLARMAGMLDYAVTVCDPREEYRATWNVPQTTLRSDMPDDAVVALRPDCRTVIIALTHDPRLDDMALLEALKSPAFYVGALGGQQHQAQRRARLALFDLQPAQIAQLHGPVGLRLGSRAPAEIAIAILAELIGLRSGVLPAP